MKLSVVIVSYNVKNYLEQCLHSVLRSTANLETDVWVVDNASTDGSVDYLATRFPDVHFISNRENVGFSRANNQAIKASKGEYVLLLNPDTIVGEDVLPTCVRFMDAHPDAGATGTAMLKDNGEFAWESRRGLPTPFTAFCKMSGLGTLFPRSRSFGRYYMRYLDRHQVNEIEAMSGAFMLLRRETLDKVGLLDEDFFMYGEDIDLSYRILQGGYKNYYQPCYILHYKGESTQKTSFRYVHVFYNAMLIFFDKHYRRRYRLFAEFIRLAVYIRALIDLLHRQSERLIDTLRGGRQKVREYNYLFIGEQSAWTEIDDLCRRNHIHADHVEATEQQAPLGHLQLNVNLQAYDYVVYDVQAYTYTTILQIMNKSAERHKVALGTYDVHTHKLVTMDNVFQ